MFQTPQADFLSMLIGAALVFFLLVRLVHGFWLWELKHQSPKNFYWRHRKVKLIDDDTIGDK